MYIGNQTKIMRKLLGKPPTVDTSNENTAGITSSPAVAAYRPNASQNAVYHAGVPIARIDASPDGKSAVLAGRHILKIVKIDGLTVKEGLDIRALITSQRAASASSASTADQLSIRDVKWAKGHEGKIFTACANGKIFRYDISRVGTATPGGTPLDTIQMAEDSRQVNTLDVNPHRGSFLLSGSQDGVVRLFDIREPVQTRRGPSFRTSQAFKCNAEGVRHVKWSPKEAFFFACGTEQGVVLKWDIRKAAAPLLRINAHEKTCTSVSWHPDGEHLISGGWDNKCHVWDMSRDKRQKPKYTISTPGLVADLAWRPGQWSATAQGKRAAQVAVTYDETSQKRFGINTVHIWDLARPTMPYKEIDRFDFSPSGILWHDQDLLWTVGQDGLFNQCDVAFAPKVLDRTSVSSMAFSARGEVLMFLDERPQARRPRLATLREAETVPSTPQNSSPTAPMLSVSRSDSEDDVVGSFLGPRKRSGRRRRPSVRSVHTLSTTPPTGPTSDDHVFSLEQTLKMTGQFKSQQAMAIGPVPSGAKPNVYQYLTMHYLETLKSGLPYVRDGPLMAERVAGIIEHYARAAENAGQFRLAQTWRILAFAVERLLSRRAQYHLERRMSRQKNQSPAWRAWKESQAQERPRLGSMVPIPEADDTPRKAHSSSSLLDKHAPLRSLLAEEFESTSNMPTPVARPVDNYAENRTRSDPVHLIGSHTDLPPVPESEDFNLPAAVHSQAIEPRKRLDSMPLSDTSFASDGTKISSTEGYDFYDMDTIVHAIDVPQTRRDPEVSDQIQPRSPSREKPLPLRHDSDESFAQLFSISQASGQSGQTSSSGSSLSRRITNPERIPVHRRSSASEAMDGEYQSRIRGKQLQNSPGSSQLLRRTLRRTSTSMTDTTDEDYRMITQTTSGSIPSQGFSSRYDEDFNSGVPQIEVADADSVAASLQDSAPIEDENSPFVIESDYYIWPSDPAFPYPTSNDKEVHKRRPVPLQPYTLISRALAFETRSSALNAAAIVLLLKPLVPNDVIDTFQAGGILRQHHSRLMGMKLFVEAALLRKLCVKGWPGGLLSDWGESYSAIFTLAQTGVSVGFLCSKCRKPRDIDRTSKSNDTVWVCDRCRETMGPCAVCKHRDTTSNIFPLDQTPLHGGGGPHHPHSTDDGQEDLRNVLSTWWYCPGCGHGGHATCLEAWHSSAAEGTSGGSPLIGSGGTDPQHIPESGTGAEFSDGCCPLDGCGHPCLPGRWRTESAATRSEELTRSMREVARGGGAVVGAGAGGAASAPGGGFKGSPLGSVGGDRGAVGDRRVSGGSGMLPLGAGIRGDGNDVLQSRAVESVREVLGGDRDGMGGGSRGVAMGSSPGRGGGVGITGGVGVGEQRERERRKSVKFAGTEDRR